MENPNSDFAEIDKLLLHSVWECQGSRIVETIAKKADTRYQEYCNTIVIKGVWNQCRDRAMKHNRASIFFFFLCTFSTNFKCTEKLQK